MAQTNPAMDLSILIVNWNSAHYLRPCLSSVYQETKGISFEVVVLDNASYDGSERLIKEEFPQAIFIQGTENLGFTKGNNFAYPYTCGRNLLLLNPDTEIRDAALTKMLAAFESLPGAGAIGCRLLNTDGSVQPSVHAFPTILNQLVDSDFLRQRFPRWRLWGMQGKSGTSSTPIEVDAVGGACLMVKRDIFEQVGMLALDYVMFGDDLDLCYRIKKAGYKVYYTGQAEVVHHGGKSTASWKQSLSDVWVRDSTYRFVVKTRGGPYGAVHKATMALSAVLRLAVVGLLFPFASTNAERRKQLVGKLAKWLRVLQWALGLNHWAQNARQDIGVNSDS
jgi:GT2 family glycosyltransferase